MVCSRIGVTRPACQLPRAARLHRLPRSPSLPTGAGRRPWRGGTTVAGRVPFSREAVTLPWLVGAVVAPETAPERGIQA
jgi:hypothetical protein